MYKVLFYTTVEPLLRICLERKKQPHGYVIQEPCLYYYWNISAVNAIPPISERYIQISLKVSQKIPGSPSDVVQ